MEMREYQRNNGFQFKNVGNRMGGGGRECMRVKNQGEKREQVKDWWKGGLKREEERWVEKKE